MKHRAWEMEWPVSVVARSVVNGRERICRAEGSYDSGWGCSLTHSVDKTVLM